MTHLPPDAWNEAATAEMAGIAGWQLLDLAQSEAARGDLTAAGDATQGALEAFERADDRAGQAAASLLWGDVHWQNGDARAARSWWARARSLADAAGATPLAARALLALALQEQGAGDPAVAEALLDAAEDRAQHELSAGLPLDALDSAVQEAERMTEAARASVALVRAERALAQRREPEARLLLSLAAESAQRLGSLELYIDALRLDAALARRGGDPRSAVESLMRACDAARLADAPKLLDLLESELVLALCDNESWADAVALQERPLPPQLEGQPVLHAARLEAYAVLALRAGRPAQAADALAQTHGIRQQAGHGVAALRVALLRTRALIAAGQPAQARQEGLAARQQALALGRADLGLEAAVLAVQADLARHGQPAAADVEEIEALAGAASDAAQHLAALDTACAAWLHLASPDRAAGLARQAVQIANHQPLLRLRARAKARLAQALAAGEAPGDAWAVAREAAEMAAQAGDEGAHALALGTVGALLLSDGRLDEGRLVLHHALETARSSGRRDLAAESAFSLGNLHATAHEWSAAREAFAASRTDAEALGRPQLALRAWRGEALTLRGLGQQEAAEQELVAALAQAREAGLAAETAAVTVDLAQLLLETRRARQARTLLAALPTQDLPAVQRGEALTLQGRLLAMARELAPAAQVLGEAVEWLRQAHAPRSLGAALLLLGQVEGMLGHGEACGALLGEALVVTARHGLPEQHLVRQIIERMTADQPAK